jgi:hypothetical protein
VGLRSMGRPAGWTCSWLRTVAAGSDNNGAINSGPSPRRLSVRRGADRLARMAFYGDLFLTPDQQGADTELSAEQLETADEIAVEWLTNALDSTRPRDAGSAQLELQALQRDPADAQSLGAVGGRIVAALDHIPWISQASLAGLGRVNKTVAQVVRYLTEPDVRDYALAHVRQQLDIDTRVVIGHSLGSVVAYEAVRAHPHPLPVLITLGSPLGPNAVNRRLLHPPAFPARLARWVNLFDRDDIVAARPQLTTVFDVNRPPTARFDSTYTVDNGAQPHRARFYLAKTTTGQAIADAMTNTGERR